MMLGQQKKEQGIHEKAPVLGRRSLKRAAKPTDPYVMLLDPLDKRDKEFAPRAKRSLSLSETSSNTTAQVLQFHARAGVKQKDLPPDLDLAHIDTVCRIMHYLCL